MIKRVLWLKILRQRHAFGRISILPAGRCEQRVVWSGKVDVEEIWFVVLALNEFDGCIGKFLFNPGSQADPLFRESLPFVGLENPATVACNCTAGIIKLW